MSEEQIQRFFAKQCTVEEAEQVAAWLKAHTEEAKIYFEETEWQQASAAELMPEEMSAKSWLFIKKRINTSKTYLILKYSAVAACIIGCMAIAGFYLSKNDSRPVPAVFSFANHQEVETTKIDTEYNVTGKVRRISMADGSVVTLLPKSMIWFDTPFARSSTRDIYLTGEACFEVAKNKLKPFTVFSGSFSTTALGTEFVVKQQLHKIRVQLIHGKVVIRNTNHLIKNWENVYLLPGQQMLYSDNDALAKISSIQEQKTASTVKLMVKEISQRETQDSLIFNGSPMSTVLQKLHNYYDVDIQFVAGDMKNITFTGVIVKKDSLQTILKAITQMNGLTLEGTNSRFVISKEKN